MTSADPGPHPRPGARSRMARPRRQPYGLQVAAVDVDGRSVRSLSAGSATDAPEVVVQAGLGAPGYLVPWVRRLARWTRASLLDLPGWRGGRAHACPPTLDGVSTAAAHWLEVTDRRSVVLLGHSTGAQAALHVARLVPDRVAGVVLAGPSFDPSVRSLRRAFVAAARTLPREPAGAAEVAAPSYLRSGGLHMLGFIRSALADACEDHVPHLARPLLVLAATRDPFCSPAWAKHLAQLGHARCHVIEGTHMAQFTHPGIADWLVRDAVRRWSTPETHP